MFLSRFLNHLYWDVLCSVFIFLWCTLMMSVIVAGITVVRRSVTAPQLPAKDMAIASSIAVLSRDSNPSSSGSPKRILCPADNSRTNNGGVVDSSRPQPASVILSKPVSNVVANEVC